MPTVWKFAEYDEATGELLHVAEFSWPGDPPEARGQFEARVRAKGHGVRFLAEDAELPHALQQKYDKDKDEFVDKPAPSVDEVGGGRP